MTLDMSQQAMLRAVLTLIERERERQETKFPDQHLPDGTRLEGDEGAAANAKWITDKHAAAGTLTWRLVLEEEVLEALAEDDPVRLFRELIQVAAVAVRWASEPRLLNAAIAAAVAEDAPQRELAAGFPMTRQRWIRIFLARDEQR